MITIGVVCTVGVGPSRGGRARNEDDFLVCRDGTVTTRTGEGPPRQGEGILLAVCDGMGGHDDGDQASALATRWLADLYRPGRPRDPVRALVKFISDTHLYLHNQARERGPVTLGTTLTAAWLLDGDLVWANVGDSRLYLCRRGRILQLSRDHTRNEFARRDGRPVVPEGEHLAQSFLYGSRGLGDNSRLRIERGRDAGVESLEVGDRLLLCSDGLTGVVDDAAIVDVLCSVDDPQRAAEACLELAVSAGSTDNVTVLVVRVDDLPDLDPDGELWEIEEDETIML